MNKFYFFNDLYLFFSGNKKKVLLNYLILFFDDFKKSNCFVFFKSIYKNVFFLFLNKNMIKVNSKFELAFRRSLFIAIILGIYLLFGSFIFLIFASIKKEKVNSN